MGSKLKLTIDPEAEIEIADAMTHYESEKTDLGEEFYNYLDGYFKVLLEGTVFFEVKRKPAFREFPLRRFPYVIIYEHTETEIYIFSVFNTSQDPSKKLK